MSVEAYSYEIFNAWKTEIYSEDYKKWQPPKIIELLSEYEPYINEDKTIIISEEKEVINSTEIFEQKALPIKFIKNTSFGIRIDSGDLAKLSKEMRRILDQEGFERAIIVVSNDLDEYLIDSLEKQDCKIDAYGVGTSLITAKGCSDFGGVYKLTAKYPNHTRSDIFSKDYEPVIKCSENIDKTTIPGPKEVFSIYKKRRNTF
jgi:nicotinate phosphoribosyltransferase